MKTALLVLLLAFAPEAHSAAKLSGLPTVSPEETKALHAQGKATVVDVREKDEIAEGMVKGATWLPMSGVLAGDASSTGTIAKLDKSREVLVYCRSGTRSGKVGIHLKGLGFKVRNAGGFSDLKEAGLPTHRPSQ